MEKYRSIDASWELDEYLYIDADGELYEYLFNNKKHYAIVRMPDYSSGGYFSTVHNSVVEKVISATIADLNTGMYEFNRDTLYRGNLYYWIYNAVLGAHNKPESLYVSDEYYVISFNRKIQKFYQISGLIENGIRTKNYNLKYFHSGQYWAFDLHSNGNLVISANPLLKRPLTLDEKKAFPSWFLKCKKDYGYYEELVEDTFAKIPLNR